MEDLQKYNLQSEFDSLYANSKNGDNLNRAHSLITSNDNIDYAISKFSHNNGVTKNDILESLNGASKYTRTYKNYNGMRQVVLDYRDSIALTAVLQVLEPWLEARYYKHSYAGRPLRLANNALSRAVSLINVAKTYQCVRVTMPKLLDDCTSTNITRSLWSLGVHDKRVLSFISDINKPEIVKSPEYSKIWTNILLTKLDNWISTQWEDFPAKDVRYLQRKHTGLKDGFMVRYGNELLIMSKSYTSSNRWRHAMIKWCSDNRIRAKINQYDLKSQYCDFIGFKLHVVAKGGTRYGYVANTHVSDVKMVQLKVNIKAQIKSIQANSYSPRSVILFNNFVSRIKDYYQYATHVNLDFDVLSKIEYRTLNARMKLTRKIGRYSAQSKVYKSRNKGMRPNSRVSIIAGIPLNVAGAIKHKNPMNYSQDKNIYSVNGRRKIKKQTTLPLRWVNELIAKSKYTSNNVDYINNRIQHYVDDGGKCFVTGTLLKPNDVHCHHVVPKTHGGNNHYDNLVIVHHTVHKLIHSNNTEFIKQSIDDLDITSHQIKKLNLLRQKAGNKPISI